MPRRFAFVANTCIAVILVSLSVVILTVDISSIYLTVSAPVYNGNRSRNNVSLMINVNWGTEYIQPMIAVLEDKGVSATWFLGGNWAKRNMGLTQKLGKEFEIGNHGFTGKEMRYMSEASQRNEIRNTHDVIRSITGIETNLFAPPRGSFGRTTLRVAENLGYRTIMWSKDTQDWRDQDEHLVFVRATQSLRNGDLVLLHPTAHTLRALPRIIDFYLINGFNVVKVSENIT